MKTITEIRDWLLANAVDEDGDLMLDNLDFSDFDGDVYIGVMKVKGDIYQDGHEVKGSLCQGGQKVRGNLWQDIQKVDGHLYQSRQVVKGNLYQGSNNYGGKLYEEPSIKLLKEITAEELSELGYKLKGEN